MKEYDITRGFTYMYFDGEVDWAFGHGLSYTTFEYSNLKVAGTIPGGPLTVTADIRNSGKRAGDEVVQLYVRDVEASVKRPKKQLMAFERINLRSGRSSHRQLHGPAGTAGVLGREAEGVDGGAWRVRGDGRQFFGRCATEG